LLVAAAAGEMVRLLAMLAVVVLEDTPVPTAALR